MNITHGLRRALQVNPKKLATIDGERRRDWEEVAARVARLAGGFRALGLTDGDRIAILALNSDRYLETYLSVAWAGGVIVPLNIRWSADENTDAMRDCRAKILIVDQAFLSVGQAIAQAIGDLTLIHADDDPTPAGLVRFETLATTAAAIPDAMRVRDDLCGIFYTGGTTGRSKGVMLSHGNLMANAFNAVGEGLFPASAIYLHAAPMFHLANGAAMFSVILNGGTHVILRAFSPVGLSQAVARHKVTDVLLVPTMIQMLADHPDVRPEDLESMRRIAYGASPISDAVLQRAAALLPGAEFIQLYGMTELSPIATVLHWHDHIGEGRAKGRHRSAGRATLGCEVRIVDGEDHNVANGVVGEITVRGDVMMMGYWERPEETARALAGGWMHTGDGGYMDEDGFVHVVDRIKDMIISGGENIYSYEVENIIARHPAVLQCAVIGIPSPQWGEQVHAFIVTKAGAQVEAAEIIAFCKRHIADYKAPRSLDIRTTPLPMSGAGKILKRELRAAYWNDQHRRVN